MNSIESVSDLGIDQQVISEKIKQMILSPKHPQTPSTMQITTTDEQNIKLELQKQFEYYFSSKNLQNDSYLRSQMDQDNYVPIAVIAQFKRIKQLTNDTDLICFVIRQSTQLQLDSSNTKVRSIGGSAGGLITITNSFTKKSNKTTFNTIEQSNLQQQRSVLILREVASEATLEQVKDLFTNKEPNCPPCHQCESAGNDSWYVTFNNEEEAQKALQYLKIEIQTFLDKPIRARIKAHTMMPRSTSASLNNNNNNNSNNNKVLNTTSPPLTPPVSTYNQHILTYDTPPSSSYMSQTSSPSPAPTYQNSLIGSTNPVTSDMMAAAFHDGSIQIMVSNDNNHQANNQYNYLNFNNNNQSQHIKYLPNSKQIGLISNHQQYLFANSTMNSPNGMRPILVPNTNNNQQHNQYWQIQNNNNNSYTQRSKYQQNDEKNVSSSTNSSTSINNDLTKTQNDSLSEIDSSKYFSSPNQNELNDALLIYPNQQQQSILQIPSYYQSQPTQPPVPQQQQQQQQQMIQIQLNSNNYNRSSPASFQAYYQPVSQSPSQSQQQQQHYISTNQQQQTALLSSASSSSINNNNNNTNNQSYQQPQYIIQNPQYLSHTQSGVAINQNYYNNNNNNSTTTNSNNNNSSNKSSTPTPITAAVATGSTSSSGSSSANTLSGSSNGSQQIITSPVYNTNPYLIATINNNPNNNTNTGGNANPAFNAAAAYQYYQAYNNAFTSGGYAQTTSNQFSNNPYTGNIQQHQQQPQIYSTNQQQQPPPPTSQAYYDIVTTQSAPIFDGSQNAIPLSALQQTNLIAIPSNVQLQSQSQVNLSQNEKTNDGSIAHIASLTAAPSQPAVFIYPNQNQYQTHNLILNTAAAGQNTTAPQLLMTTALSSTPNGPNSQQIHHITALPSYTQISSQNSSTTTNNNTSSSSNTNTTTATTTTNNNNQRRTISGSSTNNNNNPVFNSLYQVNTHRNYNSNSRIQKYATNNEANSNLNQQQQQNYYNNTHSQNYSHHHPLPLPPPSSSYHHHSSNHSHHHNYQSNKAYHQSVNSSNAHSIVSESATSSSRSSTSNTPLIMALNINNVNLNENKSIEELKNSGVGPGVETDSIKSPPNNSDLVSFPPLLNSNSNSIPVNTTNHTRQQQTLTSTSSAIVSVVQLNETAEMTSEQLDPAIICISNTAIPSTPAIINNNNSNNNNSNTNSINTNANTSQVNRHSKQAGNTNKTITGQQQTNENNQIPNISNNNQTTVSSPAKHHQGNLKQYEIIKSHLGFNTNNNNNRSDYYSQQKSNNSSTPNSIYNKSSGNSYSRKSIDGIHSQSRSHHSTNPGTQTLPSKFHSNNSERSSSTSSGSNKKFSNQQQSSNENKNELSNSSPSFNRKGNKGGSSNNKKENLKSLNENKNTQLNDQLSPTHSNNIINNSNSLSPSQINEDDSSNNSWNNKKLTFAEIVQQKANSNGVETSKLVNTTNNNTNPQEHSNVTSLVITSTNSINSSQATSPTVQQITDANSPFNSSLTSESLTTNDSLNLNESNPTITTTNSSIQV